MDILRSFLTATVCAVVLDLVWMMIIAGGFYKGQLGSLLRPASEFASRHWIAIVFVYLIIAFGIVFFVLPRASSPATALLSGALFGLVLYGLYECTNYAIIGSWPASILFLDTLWGATIGAVTSLVVYLLK